MLRLAGNFLISQGILDKKKLPGNFRGFSKLEGHHYQQPYQLFVIGLMITDLLGDRTAAEAGLQHLFAKHPELKVVEIMNSNCTDYALRLIVNRLQIVVLRLRNCSMTGDSGLNLRPRAESMVQVLDLAFCSGISDKILDFLNSIGTKSLKSLNLSHTDVEIFNAHFPALEELDLTGCRNLEAEG